MFKKEIRWDPVKNKRLKKARGASFEDLIGSVFVLKDSHPNRSHQNVMLFWYKKYVWVVPYVEEDEYIFLKTLYPSRKYTRIIMEKGDLNA